MGILLLKRNINALGYHWERRGETIHINPEILNPDVSITEITLKNAPISSLLLMGVNNDEINFITF